MPFGDTHVEGSFGHSLHHDIHRTTCRHGRSHSYDLRILACQLQEGLSEDILEFRWQVTVVRLDTFSCCCIKASGCMPDGIFSLCRLVAMALLSMQMQQLRTFHLFQLLEHPDQLHDVMPVERTEVTDVHALKDILLMTDSRLHGIA